MPQLLINWRGFPQPGGIFLTDDFDVFFSYNGKDREAVRQVREALKARSVRVWMDEEALPLGHTWQPHVTAALQKVRSAAILLGPAGFGDWQTEEAQLCVTQGVKRRIPVIPVLLAGGPSPEALPEFLRERTCLDLRNDRTGAGLDRLAREIRGTVSEPSPAPPPAETRPSHAPKLHNLPFLPLGDLFKGRDAELRTLEAKLRSSTTATAITQTQAIHGLGGIGKTRLAVEYAWQSGDRYDAALFVVAESPEALRSGLAGLSSLGLPGLSPSPSRAQEEEVATVLSWLRKHGRWLLILDNVDKDEAADAVRKVLPLLQGGQVLITSRRRNWPPGIRKQPLDELSLDEATAFLLQRTDGLRTPGEDDPGQAKKLAEILDGLPLALEQAAAYISRLQMKFSEYLEVWERERESVLDWRDQDQTDYPASLATTWQTTFRQLRPTAAAILRLTAYLAPDPIPLEMFEEGAAIIEKATGLLLEETGQESSPQTVREGLAELAAYSMVVRKGETGTVHRMVQEVLRGQIPEEHPREWIELALRLVNDFSPFEAEDVRTWSIWNVLRPHAAVVVRYADEVQIARPTSRLMANLGVYLSAKGLYNEAEPLSRRALDIEEAIDPKSSETAIRLNNFAALLREMNRLEEAEPLMRRALKIDEQALGQDHPNVAIRLNNLAQLLQTTNRLAEAEPLMRRALKIDEEAFGQDHPNVATGLINLGDLFKATSRLAEAEPLIRRALKIDEDSYGPDHPEVATDLGHLAHLLQTTNRLVEAEPLMRRAVEVFEASLGLDHPHTRIARRNLEFLLEEMNPEEPQQP